MSDRTTLVQRLRDIDRNPPNLHERQRIADELDRLQRELAEARELIASATNESLLDYEVWLDWKARRDAFLAATAQPVSPKSQGCCVIGDGYCTTHEQPVLMCATAPPAPGSNPAAT